MIRLTIQHGTTQEGAEIIPTATYMLRDHKDPDLNFDILEKRMWGLKLSELARIWFLLHRNGDEPDTNAEILNAYEGTDATLKDLLPFRGQPSCFKYQNVNPLVVAALDERVKRACAMIVEDAVYDAYLTTIARNELFFALNDPAATPSGKPLPNVSPEVRKKRTDRG
jgi:hypothetical protein